MKTEFNEACDNCFFPVFAGIALAFHAGQITLEEFHKLMDEERQKQEAKGKG